MNPLFDAIKRKVATAIADYSMIEDGDRIMVAVSGGKDSSILLMVLKDLRARAPIDFEIQPVILDQHQPGFDLQSFGKWIEHNLGLDLIVLSEDTYSIVKEKTAAGKSYCGLCSRLRRGILYNYAYEHGYNKIALGHHRDDLNQTLLLNLFFAGKNASMPPRLHSDDGRNQIIRPLAYVDEESIAKLALDYSIPVIPCNLCGSQDGLQRQRIKELLIQLKTEIPGIQQSLLAAQKNLRPSQLADPKFWSSKEPKDALLVSELSS